MILRYFRNFPVIKMLGIFDLFLACMIRIKYFDVIGSLPDIICCFNLTMKPTDLSWIHTLRLSRPSLQDNTADADRLICALRKRLNTDAVDVDLNLLKTLPHALRRWNYHVRCVVFEDRRHCRLIGLSGAAEPVPHAGLAVDLGTSRVALRLVDLIDGRTMAESGFDNPQLSISSDIDRLLARQLKSFAGKKVKALKASLGTQINGASGKEMKGFSDSLSQGKLDILNQFGSDESLVQGKIDLLSDIVAEKTGKAKVPTKEKKKGLEGILPGLLRK